MTKHHHYFERLLHPWKCYTWNSYIMEGDSGPRNISNVRLNIMSGSRGANSKHLYLSVIFAARRIFRSHAGGPFKSCRFRDVSETRLFFPKLNRNVRRRQSPVLDALDINELRRFRLLYEFDRESFNVSVLKQKMLIRQSS